MDEIQIGDVIEFGRDGERSFYRNVEGFLTDRRDGCMCTVHAGPGSAIAVAQTHIRSVTPLARKE